MTQVLAEKDASIEKSLDFLRRDRPLRAEEVCRDYLSKHPGCADHLRLLGTSLMKQSRATEAEQQLRFALTIDPNFPQLYEDIGSALAMQSKFEESIPMFEKAIQLQPALPLAQKKLGRALVAAGRGDEADEAFKDYLAQDPERAAIVKGSELQREGKSAEAIEIFSDILRNFISQFFHLPGCRGPESNHYGGITR